MNALARTIGVVGLGKMGLGIARRLLTHGYDVTGFDRDSAARSGAADSGIAVTESVKEVVAGLDAPRTIWLMVPAGAATEEVVLEMSERLSKGDLLVDGGNSYYRDSMRRAEVLATNGILFLDVGTSGGVGGEPLGYCVMVGGAGEAVDRAVEIFDALSFDGRAGWRHVGPNLGLQDRDDVRRFFEDFPDRVMFGSDQHALPGDPVCIAKLTACTLDRRSAA